MTVQVWRLEGGHFFFLSSLCENSPCDLKCNVDCSAKQRKQHYDLFKRHGASPLSALGRPGRPRFQEKIRSTGHSGAGKELSRLHLWDAAPRGSLAAAFKAYHNYGANLQLRLCQCGSKKRGLVLDKPRGIVYTENAKGAGPYKRLAPYQIVRKDDRSSLVAWRRSFFLFVITVRDSPCDLKCNVDCSAKQRKQHYDLFKRHGASPLSALGRPGEAEISRKNSLHRALRCR